MSFLSNVVNNRLLIIWCYL